jgi:hypothetical protein
MAKRARIRSMSHDMGGWAIEEKGYRRPETEAAITLFDGLFQVLCIDVGMCFFNIMVSSLLAHPYCH